jgi:small multidrug resistance pump
VGTPSSRRWLVMLGCFPFVPESELIMCWRWLFLAISLEGAATIFMKLSNGFTRLVPTVAMVLFYLLSFGPMTIAIKRMEVGAVYAIWSAVGTATVAILGIVIFHEPTSALKVVSIGLIILGVVCLNLSSSHGSKSRAQENIQVSGELQADATPPPAQARSAVVAPQAAMANATRR